MKTRKNNKGDRDYVEEIVRNRMGLKVNIVSAERIGVRKDKMFITKIWRPLKVTFKNEEENKNRKNATKNFPFISIQIP